MAPIQSSTRTPKEPVFTPDFLPGFEQATLHLESEGDGALTATLVRTIRPAPDGRQAVLYIHGFVDYFFQTHLAEQFELAGFRFYALDLRRYGRSIRPQNRANMARAITDYFKEIDWALQCITEQHGSARALIAHSTGGLIAGMYLKDKECRHDVGALIVNSPFLQFNLGRVDELKARAASALGRLYPWVKLPERISPIYGMTLHRSEAGCWDYDLEKKPLLGFPLYAGWFHMIGGAHREIIQGPPLELPVLSLHSSRSSFPKKQPCEADFQTDIVLNVEHIRQLSPRLGTNVKVVEVRGGVHDLTLSKPEPRQFALAKMVEFTSSVSPLD